MAKIVKFPGKTINVSKEVEDISDHLKSEAYEVYRRNRFPTLDQYKILVDLLIQGERNQALVFIRQMNDCSLRDAHDWLMEFKRTHFNKIYGEV